MKGRKELSAEAQEQRRAYYREYRRRNPEKMREYARRAWEKKAAEAAERDFINRLLEEGEDEE